MATVNERISELQNKFQLTEGERLELDRLLNMKWGNSVPKSESDKTRDTRQLLVEG